MWVYMHRIDTPTHMHVLHASAHVSASTENCTQVKLSVLLYLCHCDYMLTLVEDCRVLPHAEYRNSWKDCQATEVPNLSELVT